MIKEISTKIKYMLFSIFESILYDFKELIKNIGRPKEMLNLLFYISMILAFMQKWDTLKYVACIYVLVYIWHIITDGRWKNLMRERYKKQAEKRKF